MPNWCYSKICFYGNDKAIYSLYNAIQNTYEFIKQMRDLGNVPFWSSIYSNELWIGYIAEYAYNLNTNTENRGFITKIGDLTDCLFYSKFEIAVRDANNPKFAFWDSMIKHVYGDNMINISFITHEESGSIHVTNDPSMSELYHYDIYAEGKEKLMAFDKIWEINESCPIFARLRCDEFDTVGMYGGEVYIEDIDHTFAHEGTIQDAIAFVSKYKTIDPSMSAHDLSLIPGVCIQKIRLTSINELLLEEYYINSYYYYKCKYDKWFPDCAIDVNVYGIPECQKTSNLFAFKGGPEE